MKPKIGTRIYCIYGDGILVDEVAFLGKESFIVASLSDDTEPDSWEWRYKDYEKNWFTSLAKAKKELRNLWEGIFKDGFKIIKVSDTWYQIDED